MRLVRWAFNNLHLPMMEDAQGKLYCTNQALTSALGLSPATLRELYAQHKEEFEGACVSSPDAKEFLQRHKTEFGIRRLREDMHLWSEEDMIVIAVLSRSPIGVEFRRGIVQLVKSNAKRGYVSKEQYDRDLGELRGQLQYLMEAVQQSQPALQTAASAAGSALQAQRDTKHLRSVK